MRRFYLEFFLGVGLINVTTGMASDTTMERDNRVPDQVYVAMFTQASKEFAKKDKELSKEKAKDILFTMQQRILSNLKADPSTEPKEYEAISDEEVDLFLGQINYEKKLLALKKYKQAVATESVK